jgi:hypothetical protein
MPDEDDEPSAFTQHHGEPMPDADEMSTAPMHHGEPMPDADEPSTKSTDPGEPMTDHVEMSTAPTHHGAPMPDDDDDDTLPGFPPADFARAELSGIARNLGHDEVRVLTRIAVRLRQGREVYGPLDLATDAREFRSKEAREEVEDALVYLACAWLKTATQEVTR